MKLTAGQCPALLTAIGKEIRDLWHGFKTFVTWDITNYLNDTNFNENAQVMYQYDQDGKEKASYTYG